MAFAWSIQHCQLKDLNVVDVYVEVEANLLSLYHSKWYFIYYIQNTGLDIWRMCSPQCKWTETKLYWWLSGWIAEFHYFELRIWTWKLQYLWKKGRMNCQIVNKQIILNIFRFILVWSGSWSSFYFSIKHLTFRS